MAHDNSLGQFLNNAICEAIGVDPSRVMRVVIDSQYDKPVKVVVEMLPSDMTAVDWSSLLQNVEVTTVGQPVRDVKKMTIGELYKALVEEDLRRNR